MKQKKWKYLAPRRATRKVPDNADQLCYLMMLRLAWFVLMHHIPIWLVISADQTGLHYVQQRGKSWMTPEQADRGDTSVQGLGDKREIRWPWLDREGRVA